MSSFKNAWMRWSFIIVTLFCVRTAKCELSSRDQWNQDLQLMRGTTYRNGINDLLQLTHLWERHPAWWNKIPMTLRAVQAKVEKACHKNNHTLGNHYNVRIMHFFHAHPPLTAKQWMFYRSVCFQNQPDQMSMSFDTKKSLTPQKASDQKDISCPSSRNKIAEKNVNPAVLFRKNLYHYWITADFSPTKQAEMLNHFGKEIPEKIHAHRILCLLWKSQPEIAQELLKYIGPSYQALKIAHRLLTKDAYIHDPHALRDLQSLSPKQRKWRIVTMAQVKFLIRASQARPAYQAYCQGMREVIPNDPSWGEGVYKKDLHSAVLSCMEKLIISLMHEQIQDGHKYEVKGRKGEAQCSYQRVLALPFMGSQAWAEELWWRGFTYFACLKEPRKALPYFLILAQWPRLTAQTKQIMNNQGISVPANRVFAPKTEYRYRTRGSFWAGLCYEKLGQFKESKQCYERAALCPFFFYGQMAYHKLKRPLAMQFAKTSSHKGLQSTLQKFILSIFHHWNIKKGKDSMESYAPCAAHLIKDLMNTLETPADKKAAIALVQHMNPCETTYLAKSLTWNPETTFPEAYPIMPLPVPAKDKALVYGITLAETCFNPFVISSAGARGIMQIMPHEAPRIAQQAGLTYHPQKLHDVNYGFRLGIAELSDKLKQYPQYIFAIAAYNAGFKKASQWKANTPLANTPEAAWVWIESIPYAETRGYTSRVLENRFVYLWRIGHIVTPKEIEVLFQGH